MVGPDLSPARTTGDGTRRGAAAEHGRRCPQPGDAAPYRPRQGAGEGVRWRRRHRRGLGEYAQAAGRRGRHGPGRRRAGAIAGLGRSGRGPRSESSRSGAGIGRTRGRGWSRAGVRGAGRLIPVLLALFVISASAPPPAPGEAARVPSRPGPPRLPAPMAWWRFEETAGRTALDSSGHYFHAAIGGGVTRTAVCPDLSVHVGPGVQPYLPLPCPSCWD